MRTRKRKTRRAKESRIDQIQEQRRAEQRTGHQRTAARAEESKTLYESIESVNKAYTVSLSKLLQVAVAQNHLFLNEITRADAMHKTICF